jgi:hypothetical protein
MVPPFSKLKKIKERTRESQLGLEMMGWKIENHF